MIGDGKIKAIILATISINIAAAVPVFAADNAKPLTYEQVLSVLAGLTALDEGTSQVARDGQREVVVHHAFLFDPGLRVQIGLAEVRLRDARRTYQETYNGLVREFSAGGEAVASPHLAEFESAIKKLNESSSGVVLPHIQLVELKLNNNSEVTGGMLSLLDPILDK